MAKVLRSVALIGLVTALGATGSVGFAAPNGVLATSTEARGADQGAENNAGAEGRSGGVALSPEQIAAANKVDASPLLAPEGTDPDKIVGDFDGDGTPDSVVAGTDSSRTSEGVLACWADFALSSLGGQVKRSAVEVAVDGEGSELSCPSNYAVTDFNGDGAQELYAYNPYADESGSIVFSPETAIKYDYLKGAPHEWGDTLIFDDLNADGKTDLVAAAGLGKWNGELRVYLTGESGEPLWDNLVYSANASDVEVVDIDPTSNGKEVVYASNNYLDRDGEKYDFTTLDIFHPISKDTRPLRVSPGREHDVAELDSGPLPQGGEGLAVSWSSSWDEGYEHVTELFKMTADRVLVEADDYPVPVVRNDRVQLLNGDHVSGCVPVLGNDDNTLGAKIVITAGPNKGEAFVAQKDGSSCIYYGWAGNEAGDDELRYKLVGPNGESQEAFLRLHIQGGPVQTPVAHDDEVTLDYADGPTTCIPVKTNDEAAEHANIKLVEQARRGYAEVSVDDHGNSCIKYERNQPGIAEDYLSYNLTYAGRESETAEVLVTLENPPAAPVAANDTLEWPYDAAMPDCMPVLANDQVEGQPELNVWNSPSHGYLSVSQTLGENPQPCLQYNPFSVAQDRDRFEYQVSTIGGQSEASVKVVRTGQKPDVPVAEAAAFSVPAGSFTEHCLLGSESGYGPVDVVILSEEGYGYVYPGENNGCVSFDASNLTSPVELEFTYLLRNASGQSEEATLTFTVETAPGEGTVLPVAVNDRVVMNYQENLRGCIPVLGNDKSVHDADGNVLDGVELALVEGPTAGWAGVNGHCIDYRRLPDAVGDDSFTYMVYAPNGESEEATVRIIMRGTPPVGAEAVAF